MGTGKSGSARGQEIAGIKLPLLLGKDLAATSGKKCCVLAAIEVLGEGQQCQVEVEGQALVQENIPSAVPDSCLLCLLVGFAGKDSALLHFVSDPLYQARDNLLFIVVFRNSPTQQQQDLRQKSL